MSLTVYGELLRASEGTTTATENYTNINCKFETHAAHSNVGSALFLWFYDWHFEIFVYHISAILTIESLLQCNYAFHSFICSCRNGRWDVFGFQLRKELTNPEYHMPIYCFPQIVNLMQLMNIRSQTCVNMNRNNNPRFIRI